MFHGTILFFLSCFLQFYFSRFCLQQNILCICLCVCACVFLRVFAKKDLLYNSLCTLVVAVPFSQKPIYIESMFFFCLIFFFVLFHSLEHCVFPLTSSSLNRIRVQQILIFYLDFFFCRYLR